MPKFPSVEWAGAVRDRINANPAYAEAARAWEGDFLLVVNPDAAAPRGEGIHLDLFHGVCRSAGYTDDPAGIDAEFTVTASRADWGRLFRREIEPIRSLLAGTLRLRGNLPKAMRFQRAAQEMLASAARVPTDL